MAEALSERIRVRREYDHNAQTPLPVNANLNRAPFMPVYTDRNISRPDRRRQERATDGGEVNLVIACSTIGNNLVGLANNYCEIHPSIAANASDESLLRHILEDKLALEQAAVSAGQSKTADLQSSWRTIEELQAMQQAATSSYEYAFDEFSPTSSRSVWVLNEYWQHYARPEIEEMRKLIGVLVSKMDQAASQVNVPAFITDTKPESPVRAVRSPSPVPIQPQTADPDVAKFVQPAIGPTSKSTGYDLLTLFNIVLVSTRTLAACQPQSIQLQANADRLLVWTTDLSEWLKDPTLAGDGFSCAADHIQNVVISDLVELGVKESMRMS